MGAQLSLPNTKKEAAIQVASVGLSIFLARTTYKIIRWQFSNPVPSPIGPPYYPPVRGGMFGLFAGDMSDLLNREHDPEIPFLAKMRKSPNRNFVSRTGLNTYTVVIGNRKDATWFLSQDHAAPDPFFTSLIGRYIGHEGFAAMADAKEHRKNRSKIGPVFSPKSVEEIAHFLIPRHVQNVLNSIEEHIKKNGEGSLIDVSELIRNLSARIMAEACFGAQDAEKADWYNAKLYEGEKAFGNPLRFQGKEDQCVKDNEILAQMQAMFDREIGAKCEEIIAEEKANIDSLEGRGESTVNRTFLEYMVSQRHRLKPREIVSNATALCVGAMDAVTKNMINAMVIVAKHPEANEKLFDELCESLAPNTICSTEESSKMPYLNACIRESFRMQPSGVFAPRFNTKDCVLPGSKEFIPANVLVSVNMPGLSRDESVYGDNIDEWIPERWESEHLKELEAKGELLYTNFGGGIFSCIGRQYALYIIRMGMAAIFRNYKLEWDEKQPTFRRVFASPSFGHAGTIRMKVSHRQNRSDIPQEE